MLNIIPENKCKEYNLDYLEYKYVNCKYLIGMKEITSETGLLVAVSDNEDDYDKLTDIMWQLDESDLSLHYLICGCYNCSIASVMYVFQGENDNGNSKVKK